MKSVLLRRIRTLPLIPLFLFAWALSTDAESVPVRHLQGTIHGFLVMRSDDGHVLASGDIIQVSHGGQVNSETIFHFKDGSIDDETTVYSQRHNFELVTDHHVQKGPAFPHPMDMLVDARSGQVTVHSTDKDGKDEVKSEHMKLPPDLANGIVPLIIENIKAGGATATTVSMVVATPKPRIVKLAISSMGEDTFNVEGAPGKAFHYEIKIDLGGVAGIVAPMIGKQPPNIQVWTVGGSAPTFVREQGPIYAEGPVMTIELASPTWTSAGTHTGQ